MQQQNRGRTYSETEVAKLMQDKRMHGICGGYLAGCFFGYFFTNDFFKPLSLVPAIMGIALIFVCGVFGALIVHFVGGACISFADAFDKYPKRYGPAFLAVVFILIPLIGVAIALFAPGEG